MSTIRQIAKAVITGWVGVAASIVVGFLMAPFLIRHLGVVGYGVWILIQSTVSYMYVLDLGLRTAVMRFVARDYANLNHREVSRVVSAAIWVRLWSGGVVLLITATIATILPCLFSIPTQYLMPARLALLLVGLTLASTLVFSVFAATLMAVGSFDLLARLELLQILLSAAGIVPIIRAGYGIVGMACWHFGAVTTINIAIVATCFRAYPELHLTLTRVPERQLLRSLWSVGMSILGYNIAGQLIGYTDNLVVGAFVSAAALSYYAVAGKMVEYMRQVAGAIIKYFTPLASVFEARSEFKRLENLQVKGTQAVALITLPIATILFIRGGAFLALWIGKDFQTTATPVLKLLVFAFALSLPNVGTPSLAIAFGKQQWLAWLTIIEGVTNLALSVTLAHSIGILGVAIGTAVPSAIMQLLVWPQVTCRLLHTSPSHLFRETWLRPVIAVVPFAFACYLTEQYWIPRTLAHYSLQLLVLMPLVALGAVAVFWSDASVIWRYAMTRFKLLEQVP